MIKFNSTLFTTDIINRKDLQHSGALCADEAADGCVDVGGAALLTVEALLVLNNTPLDLPIIWPWLPFDFVVSRIRILKFRL